MPLVEGDATTWFARHLVVLECLYKVRHPNKPVEEARAYYTGFLLQEKNFIFWVTAGHCLDEIRNVLLAKPEFFEDVIFRFVDFFHDDPISTLPIPFDPKAIQDAPFLFHTDSAGVELGWDWGCVILDPHYARLLLTNKVVPLEERNWVEIPEEFDRHHLLGIPSENVKRDEHGNWTAFPSMFSITKREDRPEEFAKQTDTMFYATIDPQSGVDDIKGMSGGPILGCKKMGDGSLRYWVIAVQSRWIRSKRLICATPLRNFRDLIAKGIDDAIARLGQTN